MTVKTDKSHKPKPPNRVEKKYHSSGEIKSTTTYVNGKKHGIETEWWDYYNGILWSTTTYVNGKKHGIETEWWGNGMKRHEVMWVNNEMHGLDTRWWWQNGRKERELTWKAGKQHGVQTKWHKDGTKRSETYCDLAEYLRLRGVWGKDAPKIAWDAQGNVIAANFPYRITAKMDPITKSRKLTRTMV